MAGRVRIRQGTAADARPLAELMNAAGEGIPAYLWSQMAASGEEALAFGARRVQQRDGAFSFSNTRVAVVDEALAGMLLSYRLPDPYEFGPSDDVPPIVRPALELESFVPGSWYVNAVATAAAFRGRGIAGALMVDAERLAREAGAQIISLIVAQSNQPARELYRKFGYRVWARRAIVPFPGFLHDGDWLLQCKELA